MVCEVEGRCLMLAQESSMPRLQMRGQSACRSISTSTRASTPFRTSHRNSIAKMSYYFAIIGTQDNPLFEYEFGTSKQGGDGVARFPEQARHMNQFIVHSSLDIVEEVQWAGGQMCADILFHISWVLSFH